MKKFQRITIMEETLFHYQWNPDRSLEDLGNVEKIKNFITKLPNDKQKQIKIQQ